MRYEEQQFVHEPDVRGNGRLSLLLLHTMIELVLGGARAGKSAYAERRTLEHGPPVTWIVTAQASDDEMAARIAAHRARRPADCRVIEEPLRLAHALGNLGDASGLVVIDCLTLWVANLLKDDGVSMQDELESFLNKIKEKKWELIVISNEVGSGIVPVNALARRYRDDLGRLNQRVAEIADRVLLMIAGLPVPVKGEAHVRT